MEHTDLVDAARAWIAADHDPETRGIVEGWLAAEDIDALREHFSGVLGFGTGGMRGAMGPGTLRMNRLMVRRVTEAVARHLLDAIPDAAARGVAIGYDARRHSRAFAEEAAGVFAQHGVRVHLSDDVVPTPVLGYATTALGCAAGVVVTASHNPPADNGYKLFWANGAQIVPPIDTAIQDILFALSGTVAAVAPSDSALVTPWPADLLDRYHAAVQGLRVHHAQGAKVVYTPVHGVGGAHVARAMATAGHELVAVPEQAEPDGSFPTVTFPNPEEPGVLDLAKALATEVGAQAILANDPDADRLAVAVPDGDGGWVQLSGNELGVLLADDLLASADVGPDDLVVTTIVSTAMLARIAKAHGVAYDEALTGFKWIADKALAHEAKGGRFLFGFEESIGYSVGNLVRDKDGVSAALLVADLIAHLDAEGRTLSDRLEGLYRRHGLHVGTQRSIRLPGTAGKARIAEAMEVLRGDPPKTLAGRKVVAVRDLRASRGVRDDGTPFDIDLPSSNVMAYDLADGSRALVRPSGTEPKIKFYGEVVVAVGDATLDAVRPGAEAELDALVAEVVARAGLADA